MTCLSNLHLARAFSNNGILDMVGFLMVFSTSYYWGAFIIHRWSPPQAATSI